MEQNEKQIITLQQGDMREFWSYIQESYRIEQMRDEHHHALITLKDRFGMCQFFYVISELDQESEREMEEVLVYGRDGQPMATLSKVGNVLRGRAFDDRGKRKFLQCLKMFQKAIEQGTVFLEVERLSDSQQFAKQVANQVLVELEYCC